MFPLIKTLKNYPPKWLRYDVIAGLTVAAVAVPQTMAYAQLAGMPLVTGLYSALVAMLTYCFFTSSRYIIVGPDAAMAALTGATLLPLANGDPTRYVSLVIALTVLIGICCFVAVLAKLSFFAEFLSRPILLGYMAGLALAVIASQAPKIFGLNAPARGSFFTTITYMVTHLSKVHLLTLGLSAVMLILMLLLQKIKKIPAGLILLIAVTIASAIFDFKSRGVATVGVVPTGLPIPDWPKLTIYDIQGLVVPAIAITVIAYANTIANARSFAVAEGKAVHPKQEFVGLGVSNVAVGIFGGMPVAGSGARTAVNHHAGAKSQLSQLLAAAIVAAVLLFLAPSLQYLPQAALAVIVITAVMKLFDFKEFKSIWHAWRIEAILAIVTVLGVTLLGIFQGLLLAVILAMANLIHRTSFPSDAVLGVAADGSVRDSKRPPKTTQIPGLIMYRFDAPLFFANASYFKMRVEQLLDNSETPVKWFIWDAETITGIDSTAGKMLGQVIRELKKRKVTFVIARLKGPVRTTINHTRRLSRQMQNTPHYTSIGKALAAFHELESEEAKKEEAKANDKAK